MEYLIRNENLPKYNEFKYFEIEEHKIEFIVYNENGKKYLIYNSFCPHNGGQLFINKQKIIECNFHGYRFDSNGNCINKILKTKITKYNYTNFDGGIIIHYE
jgi:nitrite reductase/ring-hydroxylating ferredoxin subunit